MYTPKHERVLLQMSSFGCDGKCSDLTSTNNSYGWCSLFKTRV